MSLLNLQMKKKDSAGSDQKKDGDGGEPKKGLAAGMKKIGPMSKSPSGSLSKKGGLGKKGGIAPYAPPKSSIEEFLNSTSAVSGYTPHHEQSSSSKTTVQHSLRIGSNLIQDVSVEGVYFDQLIVHSE